MNKKILSILVALIFVMGFASISLAFEVIKPAAGESVPTGALYTAIWTEQPGAAFYKVKLSIDGGVTWLTLGAVSGTIVPWPVPATINKNITAILKVIAYDSNNIKLGVAKSGTFSVDVLTITAPIAAEVVPQNSTYSITWKANGTATPPDDAVVKYTLNNGTTWNTAQGTLDLGASNFSWSVPAVSKTKNNVQVKVTLKGAGVTVAKAISAKFTVQ
jgi:ribosomal protein L30E